MTVGHGIDRSVNTISVDTVSVGPGIHDGVVTVIVPDAIDAPERPSGGNRYDRAVIDGLRNLGLTVREVRLGGDWPHATGVERAGLAAALASVDRGGVILIDGLIASGAAGAVCAAARHARIVVLMHLPLGVGDPEATTSERHMCGAVTGIVATSSWTARWLMELYGVSQGRIVVAPPGVDAAPLSPPTPSGHRLLCVAPLTVSKGYDVLAAALPRLADLSWTWTAVGRTDPEPATTRRFRSIMATAGFTDRMRLTGPLSRADLAAEYTDADLLVLPSRIETYGMVVTEALARGIPVVTTEVGGTGEALGSAPDGSVPGLRVSAGDPAVLVAALRGWLMDPTLRSRWRAAADGRRRELGSWQDTAAQVAGCLDDTLRAAQCSSKLDASQNLVEVGHDRHAVS